MKGGLPLILMEGGLPLILQTHHITQDAFPAKSLILSSINTLENSLLNDSSGKLFSFFSNFEYNTRTKVQGRKNDPKTGLSI